MFFKLKKKQVSKLTSPGQQTASCSQKLTAYTIVFAGVCLKNKYCIIMADMV